MFLVLIMKNNGKDFNPPPPFLLMFVNFLNSIFFLYLVKYFNPIKTQDFLQPITTKSIEKTFTCLYVKDVNKRYFLKSLTCQKKSPAWSVLVIFSFPLSTYIFFFLLSHQGKQVIIQSIPISQPGAGNYKGCLPQVQNLSVLSHICGVGTFGLYRLIQVLYRWIYVSKRYTCSRHVNPAGFITDVRKNLP